MIKKILNASLKQVKDNVFFSFIFIYQLIFIFQGLDFADEGFYATFYQQIFNNPQSVQFNFMYWLTGIVGGSFHFLFPQLGLIGFRFLGVIVTTLTIILTYHLLKKYLNPYYLRISLLILIIFISNDPKELAYNNLSSLLFVTSAIFLFNGITKNKLIKIFISGVFLSLNVFTRFASITGLILMLAIIYYGYINQNTLKYQVQQLISFLSGFSLMTVFVLLFMKLINHLTIFLNCLVFIQKMGKSKDDPHNILGLIKLFINDYLSSIEYILIAIFLIIIIYSFYNVYSRKINNRLIQILPSLLYLSITILFLYLFYVKDFFGWVVLLRLFTGFSLLAATFILFKEQSNHIKLLTFIGILLLLFQPIGSGGGLYFVGRYSLWIIFSIGFDYLFNIKKVSYKLSISNNNNKYTIDFLINELQFSKIKKVFVVFCLLSSLFYAYYYPYFDRTNRIKMCYSVNSKFLKGIFTSNERAEVVNELLAESHKYIKKDDYVLAYDCIPLFHYITETRPFMNNSWPWTYPPEVFNNVLYNCLTERKNTPVIIKQVVRTIDSNWPENFLEDYSKSNIKGNSARNIYLTEFMKKYDYKKVWENKAFEIYISNRL